MSAVLDRVLAEIEVLSPEEKRRVCEKVNDWLVAEETPEMRLRRSLHATGLLREIKTPPSVRQHEFPLVEIVGQPASQILIEERR